MHLPEPTDALRNVKYDIYIVNHAVFVRKINHFRIYLTFKIINFNTVNSSLFISNYAKKSESVTEISFSQELFIMWMPKKWQGIKFPVLLNAKTICWYVLIAGNSMKFFLLIGGERKPLLVAAVNSRLFTLQHCKLNN